MLVSTVTATTSGAGRRVCAAASRAASCAARIMTSPPAAWTLTIQEHTVAALGDRPDRVRSLCREQPAANLEPTGQAAKRAGQRERPLARLHIERD